MTTTQPELFAPSETDAETLRGTFAMSREDVEKIAPQLEADGADFLLHVLRDATRSGHKTQFVFI